MDQPERVRYFDQQFLRVDDFNAEQDYHRDMRRRHNRMLHTPGIADGLLLIDDGTGVKITPGSAIPGGTDVNGGGAEIVLAAERRQELSTFAANAPMFVTIAFAQEPARFKDDAGVKDHTRWRENPVIEAFPSDPTATPPNDAKQPLRVLLGEVRRGGSDGKHVVEIVGTGRRLAGAAESELSLTPRDPTVQEPDWVRLRWIGRGQSELRGDLKLVASHSSAGALTVAGPAALAGALTVDGKATVGSGLTVAGKTSTTGDLAVGANAAVTGELAVTGALRTDGTLTVHGDIAINGKTAIRGSDTWLRLNQDNKFSAGVHTPYLLTSGRLNVGGVEAWSDPGAGNAVIAGALTVGGNATVATDLLVNGKTSTTGDLAVGANVEIKGRLGTSRKSSKPVHEGWGGGIRTFDIEADGSIWAQTSILSDGPITSKDNINAQGSIWSRGPITSASKDVAENFACDVALEPGDVVVLDRTRDIVVLCEEANDAMVLGVVSQAPAVLLGTGPDNPVDEVVAPVALAGRVACKVTTANGPIARGALLAASPQLGRAMRADPLDIDGEPVYRAGTIVGKALQSCDEATGTIDIVVLAR